MVDSFAEALKNIAESNQIVAAKLVSIDKTTQELFKIEKKERKTEEKREIEVKRRAADRAGSFADLDGDSAPEPNKPKGGITKVLRDLNKTLKGQDGNGGLLGLLKNLIPGGKLLGKQEGGFIYPSPAVGFQSGGGVFTVPGNSTGDKHPAMLRPGSFVLNRNATAALSGMQTGGAVPVMLESGEAVFSPGSWSPMIEAMNSIIPRFATGGIVEHLHGEPGRPGYRADHGTESNAHDHFAFSSPDLMAKVRDALAAGQGPSGRKWQIGSQNDGQHAVGSYHYSDQAFDIPWSQFGTGAINQNDFKQSRQLLADIKAILAGSGGKTDTPTGGAVSQPDPPQMALSAAANQNTPTESTPESNNTGPGSIFSGTGMAVMPSMFNEKGLMNLDAFGSLLQSMMNPVKGIMDGFSYIFGGLFGGNKQESPTGMSNLGNDYKSQEQAAFKGAEEYKKTGVVPDTSSAVAGNTNVPDNPGDKEAFKLIYDIAKKVGGTKYPEVVAAQAMHETGYLKAKPSVYFASGKTNPFGQTGDRGYGTIERAGFKDGWTLYPNIDTAVKDHIKLWHDVSNHPENYNAHSSIMEGIAAVAPAYSPNADPENIRRGFTEDGYSKGMMRALKVGGYQPEKKQMGGVVGGTPNMSGAITQLRNAFGDANQAKFDRDKSSGAPIIINAPSVSGGGGSSGPPVVPSGGSAVPYLPDSPSNHIVSTLMMQSYSLMQRIG